MTTENTETTQTTELVHPATGERIELETLPTDALAGGIEELNRLFDELAAFRQAVVDEVAGRMDRMNTRTERVGPFELETNAPTTEAYTPDVMRASLEELVEAKLIDRALIDRIVSDRTTVNTTTVVDKREVNKLKKSTEPKVLAAVAAARTVQQQRRTLKITRARQEPSA